MATITEEHIELLIQQERYDLAEKHTREKLSAEPENMYFQALLCQILINCDRNKEGLRVANDLLSKNADSDEFHYLAARAHMGLDNYKKALTHAKKSIELNPYDADYFAVTCAILFTQCQFREALNYANKGLELDAENISCLNLRTQSLIKLDEKDEAFQTLDTALEKDPENSFTHSNYGWSQLEKGSYKKATQHFREALRLDPNNEWAQQGLLEALKSRYWIYKVFLKYIFWLSKLTSGQQIAFFIGLWGVTRVNRFVGESYPALQPVVYVLSGVYILFVLSNWVMNHIFNFSLLFNREGKYLVKGNDRISAIITGVCLIAAILSGLVFLVFDLKIMFNAVIFFVFSALGLGSMMDVEKRSKRILAISISVFLFLMGATSLVLLAINHPGPSIYGGLLGWGFLYLSVGYTWLRGLILS